MRLFTSFPLLLLPMGIYNVLAFTTPTAGPLAEKCSALIGRSVHPLTCSLSDPFTTVRMAGTMTTPGGGVEHVQWGITPGDLLIGFSLLLLFAEVLKATGGKSSVVNHALSLVVFIFGLVEFLLLPGFATSAYFLILLMALLDVLGGFIVTIASSRRDVSVIG